MFNHPTIVFSSLIFLFLLSVFFALAETAMLSVNRYRLRHLVRHHHGLAKRVSQLLERPDRMLGVILLCDTFADVTSSALATLIAVHYWGDEGVVIATLGMTALVLIFGEIAPKTLAAMYPQQIAFMAAWPLIILLRIFYPVVWLANVISNSLLRLVGVKVQKGSLEHLSHEELISVLHEAGGKISTDYLTMLLKVLALKKTTVDDIMVPRTEIVGIDLSEDWDEILDQLTNSQYNRLPIYREEIDRVEGILHVRRALNLLAQDKLNKEMLLEAMEDIYYVPAGTPLNIQLLNFRREKHRSGLVVDEYGDILGLVTLEDILEEIVGEFTTDISDMTSRQIYPQLDGSYLVDGSISIRELNQLLKCDLPVTGPKTLSGLIIEYLETIPQSAMALRLEGLPMEIMQIKDNVIKRVRILPPLQRSLNLDNK